MAGPLTFTIGSVTLTRVPYFDIALPPEAIGLTPACVRNRTDADDWGDPAGGVRVGQAFWVIQSGSATIVVDPCCASDAFLRDGPEALTHQTAAFDAFANAGFDPEAVDIVVMSHLDGIGMNALVAPNGRWVPAFPHALLVISEPEWTRVVERPDLSGRAALFALDRRGVVERVPLPYPVTPEVRLVLAGGHTKGHANIVVESEGTRAIFLGHLAISPLSAGVGHAIELHDDPEAGRAALLTWLEDAARDDALVIGQLWPSPGAARVRSLDPVVLEPATT